jgi:hypothetical protein
MQPMAPIANPPKVLRHPVRFWFESIGTKTLIQYENLYSDYASWIAFVPEGT